MGSFLQVPIPTRLFFYFLTVWRPVNPPAASTIKKNSRPWAFPFFPVPTISWIFSQVCWPAVGLRIFLFSSKIAILWLKMIIIFFSNQYVCTLEEWANTPGANSNNLFINYSWSLRIHSLILDGSVGQNIK